MKKKIIIDLILDSRLPVKQIFKEIEDIKFLADFWIFAVLMLLFDIFCVVGGIMFVCLWGGQYVWLFFLIFLILIIWIPINITMLINIYRKKRYGERISYLSVLARSLFIWAVYSVLICAFFLEL